MNAVRVFEVKSGSIALSKSHPPLIVLDAEGIVTSSGWSNSSLGIWEYITPPIDGIQDVDFLAVGPTTDRVLQVLSKISASVSLGPVHLQNYWGDGLSLQGFRIHAASNSLEVTVEGAPEFESRQPR